MPETSIDIEPPPTPRFCEACGKDCSKSDDDVSFIVGGRTIGLLCMACYFSGVKWAAKQVRREK